MHKTMINCDTCGADLTDAGSMPTYYLTLQAVRMASTSNSECAVYVTPPLRQKMDFCGKKCLDGWLNPRTQD